MGERNAVLEGLLSTPRRRPRTRSRQRVKPTPTLDVLQCRDCYFRRRLKPEESRAWDAGGPGARTCPDCGSPRTCLDVWQPWLDA